MKPDADIAECIVGTMKADQRTNMVEFPADIQPGSFVAIQPVDD